ncbi:unnamed protein product [Lampetra fluviatilis]
MKGLSLLAPDPLGSPVAVIKDIDPPPWKGRDSANRSRRGSGQLLLVIVRWQWGNGSEGGGAIDCGRSPLPLSF